MHVYQTEPTHTLDMNATAEAERAYWLTREKRLSLLPSKSTCTSSMTRQE